MHRTRRRASASVGRRPADIRRRCGLRCTDTHSPGFQPTMRLRLPSLTRHSLCATALSLAAAAHGAVVSVAVTDPAGRPPADEVVVLEPASGKAAVKPMAGVEISQRKRQFQPSLTVVTVGT